MTFLENATQIVQKLQNCGHTAYFAGGWVRDFVMQHPSSDIDIATDATPEKVLELFPKTIKVGIAFGVVIVVEGGHQFEVSTFRKDIDYRDGRRPNAIEHSTPVEDAQRRDFTINGLFYDPMEKRILDFVDGQEDIRKGIIRTIGNPIERFTEDRLRMIRAIRFSSRFNFRIDPDTYQAIQKMANQLFPAVAIERVWQELKKMAEYPHFSHAIVKLHRAGLLQVIFPVLRDLTPETIIERTAPISCFPHDCPAILSVMELFPDLTTEDQIEICRHLKVSNENQKLVEFVHTAKQMILRDDPVSDVNWVYFYAHSHSELCLKVIAARFPENKREIFLREQEEKKARLHDHIERKIHNSPLVTSKMLFEKGIKPGIKMGELLQNAERIAIEKNLNDPENVLEELKL